MVKTKSGKKKEKTMNYSKTKYVEFRRCPKAAWLTANKPEVKKVEGGYAAAEAGIELGKLAKSYFGGYVEMSAYKDDGSLDLPAMVEATETAMRDENVQNICEAAFAYDGLYCAVDILHRAKMGDVDGWEIYEVKSSSEVKDHYFPDIAYQSYVAKKCGVRILGSYILYVNKDYVKHGELDVHELLVADDKSKRSLRNIEEFLAVPLMLDEAESCLREAEFDCIGKQCGDWCGYWEYCTRNFPKPNVFDLYNFRKKQECYEKGIKSFDDIIKSGVKLSEIQRRQIEFSKMPEGEIYIDKEKINAFLNSLTFPLYFLDFETVAPAIPMYEGTRPYQEIPFQFSLHIVEKEDGEVSHIEFLGEPETDPRRTIAGQLCKYIPKGACLLAYHCATESGIIKKLAEVFDAEEERVVREHLLDLASHFHEMKEPFGSAYYKRAMGGSFSIKSVLPAVFPELDYRNLESVQSGTDAMSIYPKMMEMSPEDRKRTREQLLDYCGRDTYAMVKLWQELVRESK